MSRRITKDLKRQMAQALVERAMEESHRALLEAGDALVAKSVELRYAGWLNWMRKAPPGALAEIEGRASYRFGDVWTNVPISKPVAVFFCDHYSFTEEASSEETAALKKFEELNDAHGERLTKLHVDARNALARYNTFKQLFEGWPECKEVLQKFAYENDVAVAYPMTVKNDELNKEFKLP